MRNNLRSTIVILTLLILFLSDNANGVTTWERTEQNSNNKFSKHQFALELGYRIDDRSDTDLPMQYSAQYLSFLTRHFAFQFKFGFAETVRFDDRSDGNSYTYTLGIRLQQPEKLFTPFTEFGLSLQRAVGNIDGNHYSESKVGWHLGLGMSIKSGKKNHIDFGINQLLNGFGPRPDFLPLLPESGGPYKRSVEGADTRDLFGPAYLYARYRFSF